MKYLMIAIAFVGATATASAFAQTSAQLAQNSNSTVEQAGQWVPPYGEEQAPKTRAQVYQELVHAEQDGQMQYLNSTIYEH
jgi:hypothetical protein